MERIAGRFAGHNVVCDLFGLPTLLLRRQSSAERAAQGKL